MPRSVVVDTSVLVIFDKINRLDILEKLYLEIYITQQIANEYGKSLPVWIRIDSVKDKRYQRFIETQLGLGESSAIALAAEKKDSLLVLDDLKARKLAKRLDLRFTGTLGIINKAKEMGIIDKIRPLIDKFRTTDFRIPESIIDELLKRNNE